MKRRTTAVRVCAMLLTVAMLACAPDAAAFADAEEAQEEKQAFCGKTEHTHTEDCYLQLCCGLEEGEPEHVHTEECYGEQPMLLRGLEEREGHSHSDACYEERPVLLCGLEEGEEHTHTDACWGTERLLICELEEQAGHSHSEECRGTECVCICEHEETLHVHSEDCYIIEDSPVCGLEEHTHALACYADLGADVEGWNDWVRSVSGAALSGCWAEDLLAVARTQLGYDESAFNYIVDENGIKQGYTRYGAWFCNGYGDLVYGEWCAFFVSLCLYFAVVRTMPLDCGCSTWVETLTGLGWYHDLGDYEPKPGDLVFFHSGWEEDALAHRSSHVGIVVEADENGITTIEGNHGPVDYHSYPYTRTKTILGFAELPENPDLLKQSSEDESVSAPDEPAEEAELIVDSLSENDLALLRQEAMCAVFGGGQSSVPDEREEQLQEPLTVQVENAETAEEETSFAKTTADDEEIFSKAKEIAEESLGAEAAEADIPLLKEKIMKNIH